MGNAVSVAAAPALCLAVGALELSNLLDPGSSGAGAAQAPPPGGAVRELLLLAAAGGLFTAAASTYRHLRRADTRRLSDLFALLYASAGALQFFIFVVQVQPAGSGVDPVERARALGLAALRAIPAAATVNFFLGMMLIVVGRIRAGGEGGGGAIAGEEGPIQAPVGVGLLTKMAVVAAAALVCLMAVALHYGA